MPTNTLDIWTFEQFEISTDLARLDRDLTVATLRATYWAQALSREVIWRSIENSRVYGIYDQAKDIQVGFCRLATDMARFAWVSDVFVIDDYKGQGLGKWLMACVVGDPALATVDRWMLATDDAHGLYAQTGFEPIAAADLSKMMMLRRPKSA